MQMLVRRGIKVLNHSFRRSVQLSRIAQCNECSNNALSDQVLMNVLLGSNETSIVQNSFSTLNRSWQLHQRSMISSHFSSSSRNQPEDINELDEENEKVSSNESESAQNDQREGKPENQDRNRSDLVWQVQESIPNVRSKYFSIYDSFSELSIKDNVDFFKRFRREYKINDVALFGYFSLKEVQAHYKRDYRILSFLLDEKNIQKFRESFDKQKRYQKMFIDYFELPFAERSAMVAAKFGEQNVQFFLHFYPLYELFVLFAGARLKSQFSKSIEISEHLQLKEPYHLFPLARQMKRKVIYHYGPTNSGKTHAAITSLMAAKSGIYCAPLRLLAAEIYQKFKANGISCNLITGQEKIIDFESPYYSCTTEIASLKTEILFDCAVIDEIQFLGDPERGGAWTQSFLGLQAKEIHVCGDGRALNLVKSICEQIGDEFSSIPYTRMSKLKVMEKEYVLFDDLEEGDCFICFSVAETIALKQKINTYLNEQQKQLKFKSKQKISAAQSKDQQEEEEEEGQGNSGEVNYCSIIYGRQPPDIKKMQADLFNSRSNKYMVATNAIGMGLNLNIKRVVFTSFKKNMKSQRQGIDKSEILQIAGRAGRYKEDGIVCARHHNQIALLKDTLTHRDALIEKQSIKRAAFFPTFEQIEEFGNWINESAMKKDRKKLSEIFSDFTQYATCEGSYFIENEEDFCVKANLTDDLGLSMKDQFVFSQAPMRLGRSFSKEREVFRVFAQNYAKGITVSLPEILRDQTRLTKISHAQEQPKKEALAIYESLYSILELYVWLANKFGAKAFPDKEIADQSKITICESMNQIHSMNKYS